MKNEYSNPEQVASRYAVAGLALVLLFQSIGNYFFGNNFYFLKKIDVIDFEINTKYILYSFPVLIYSIVYTIEFIFSKQGKKIFKPTLYFVLSVAISVSFFFFIAIIPIISRVTLPPMLLFAMITGLTGYLDSDEHGPIFTVFVVPMVTLFSLFFVKIFDWHILFWSLLISSFIGLFIAGIGSFIISIPYMIYLIILKFEKLFILYFRFL